MRKLSKKKISLVVVGAIALLAVGAAAYVHYSRPAAPSTSQGTKPDTAQSDSSSTTDSTNTNATSTVTPSPAPVPAPTADGKPQSEATTPTPSALTLSIVSSAGANPIMVITNKVATGSCTFVFSLSGTSITKSAPLNPVTNYSGCSYTVGSGELTAGTWNVKVSAPDGSATATANGTVTVN